MMWRFLAICTLFSLSKSQSSDRMNVLTYSLMQEFLNRLENSENIDDLPSYEMENADRLAKGSTSDYDLHPIRFQTRDDILLQPEPSPRKEYLEHSSLWGHQYMQGGAGEGNQHLKPDGSVKNVQVIKTDAVLPAYCNPPNPCPIGYSTEDGCIEDFSNTAAFSREYQSAQECMCDTEHMFDCPGNTYENELETLARSIQNEGNMDTTLDKLVHTIPQDSEHKVVAKKFFSTKLHEQYSDQFSKKAKHAASNVNTKTLGKNPYFNGDKLPVVAKKSPNRAKGV